MEKVVERLIEKYLLKDIARITEAVYASKFDEAFKQSCEAKDQRNTTIAQTFAKLHELALVEVVDFFGDYLEEINLSRSMSRENPFYHVVWDLWYEAKDYLYFNDYISSILDDLMYDKRIELEKAGILDDEGDFIQK